MSEFALLSQQIADRVAAAFLMKLLPLFVIVTNFEPFCMMLPGDCVVCSEVNLVAFGSKRLHVWSAVEDGSE